MELKKGLIVIVVLLIIILNLLNIYIAFTVTGRSTITTGTVSMCIQSPPTITDITNKRIQYGNSFSYQVNATDQIGETLTYSDNSSIFNINTQSGLISFTPTKQQVSNNSIKITVTDNAPGCATSSTKTFNLEVYNLAPTLNVTIPNQSWEEDVQLTGLDLDNYFADPENDFLNYTATNGEHITITINNNPNHMNKGVVTFKPESDWYGITWVIFTANDTLDATNSNNITLNITQITNYCGDGICNSNEDCSNCSADCNTCLPSNSGSSGGGGGGRSTTITKNITTYKNAKCLTQIKCSPWLPEECTNAEKQTRECIKVLDDCTLTEYSEERECPCQEKLICTIWQPDKCPQDGLFKRNCYDLNECGKEITLPLTKVCSSEGKVEEDKLPFVGAALGTIKKVDPIVLLILVFIVILIVVILIISVKKINKKKTIIDNYELTKYKKKKPIKKN